MSSAAPAADVVITGSPHAMASVITMPQGRHGMSKALAKIADEQEQRLIVARAAELEPRRRAIAGADAEIELSGIDTVGDHDNVRR